MLYIQFAEVIFKEQTDQFTSKAAKMVQEACELIDAGFEYVCDIDRVKLSEAQIKSYPKHGKSN